MSYYSFIAAKLATVLSEKVIPENKVSVPFIILSKDTDPMTLGDHKWLAEAKLNASFADEVRTGNAEFDAGITIGQLFNHNRNGVFVTDIEKLIQQGTMTDGTNTIAFAPTVEDALKLYEGKTGVPNVDLTKATVKPVKKRTRRTKAEMEAARAVEEVKVIDTSSLAMNTPEENVEEPEEVTETEVEEVTETTPAAEVTEVTETVTEPVEEKVEESENVVEDVITDTAAPAEEDPVKDIFDSVNEDILAGFTETATTGTEEKPEKMVFPEVPTGDPNYEKLKRNLIQSGVTNADIPYVLTALQISEGKDNLRAALMKTIGIEDEVDSILTKMQADRYYKGYKDLAMEIVPYEAYI